MSVPMRRPLTDGVKIQVGEKNARLYILPRDEAQGLMKILGQYEVQDRVDWRGSMKDLLDKHSESGVALKAERIMAKMTQAQLASELGVPQHVISEMESGKRPLGKKMAIRLAKIFKTDYRFFL